MDKINACIVSFFMDNIDMKTVGLQKSVVEKYNVSKYPHYHVKTDMRHAVSIDYFWCMNGVKVDTFKGQNIEKKLDHDVILFLDIDAIPLSEAAIDYYIEKAANDRFIGNVQRSNHIDNNQHVFVAPSAAAISADSFLTIGKPSAIETSRGDVMEEYTYAAEKTGIVPVDFIMPKRFDAVPFRQAWETNREPFWRLADGMPHYGIGTTFGDDEHGDLFYHNYQIFQPGQQERFWTKCESILTA
jgi:hypothetical protein